MMLLPYRPSSELRDSGVQVSCPWHRGGLGLCLWIPKGVLVPSCSKLSWAGHTFPPPLEGVPVCRMGPRLTGTEKAQVSPARGLLNGRGILG